MELGEAGSKSSQRSLCFVLRPSFGSASFSSVQLELVVTELEVGGQWGMGVACLLDEKSSGV